MDQTQPSWSSLADSIRPTQRLTFPPPYGEFSSDPPAFNFWWGLMQFVFELPNPYEFPSFPVNASDRARLMEYVDTCDELSESPLLTHGGGVKISAKFDGATTAELDAPPLEIVRGATVLFRQVAADEERGSWNNTRNVVSRIVRDHNGGALSQHHEVLRAWNGARGKLCAHLLKSLAQERMYKQSGVADMSLFSTSDVKPLALLSLFEYGHLIHRGQRRNEYLALLGNDIDYKLKFHDFVESVIQFSHFYLGYSVLVRRLLSVEEPGVRIS
jgi:hypothetical protein